MKNLWTDIKQLLTQNQENSFQSISQFTVNGETIHYPQKMANVFNNFFVSVSYKVCFEMPKKSPLHCLKNRNMNSLFISPVTHSEIEDIIISLKNRKSIGPLSIHLKLLKLVKSGIQGL